MKNFTIKHRKEEDLDVLELNGELDAHTAPKLEEQLKELIDENQYQIIINCNNLDYIASAGLGVFMAYIEDIRSLGGDIKLTNMNEKVYNVFDLLGFPTLYDIMDKEKEAVKQFQQDSNE